MTDKKIKAQKNHDWRTKAHKRNEAIAKRNKAISRLIASWPAPSNETAKILFQ
jgi:hypothetical protein